MQQTIMPSLHKGIAAWVTYLDQSIMQRDGT